MPVSAAVALPPLLTVAGQPRPTRNSLGRLIHPTAAGVRHFWQWFGDSRVVDHAGRPRVVYHGSPFVSTAFDPARIGLRDGGFLGKGFYFSSSEACARSYQHDPWEGEPGAFYLRLCHPQVGSFATGVGYRNAMPFAGHQDGAVWTHEDLERPGYAGSQEWVVASPWQIKSATKNRGTFSALDPDTRG